MRRLIGSLAIIVVLLVTPDAGVSAQARRYCQPDQGPEFLLALASLKAQVGPAMGEPIECEHINPQGWDILQRTTTGLAVYFKETETAFFTNGHEHWALSRDGIAHWTGWHAGMPPPSTTVAPTDEASLEFPSPSTVYAMVEAVTIEQVLDAARGTLVVSRPGGQYRLETGAGCLDGAPAPGQVVFTRSPGAFAGAGSDLILSIGGTVCPISDSRPL